MQFTVKNVLTVFNHVRCFKELHEESVSKYVDNCQYHEMSVSVQCTNTNTINNTIPHHNRWAGKHADQI